MYEEVHRIGLLHSEGEGGGILLLSAASVGKAEQAAGMGSWSEVQGKCLH